jgi:uncharacterized protein with ParB-like and HNH nuclease domain
METKSLSDVFQKRIFRIPDYQRGFAWQREQLRDFWEDLINLDENRQHYTGLLTLRSVEKENIAKDSEEHWLVDEHGYKVYQVVDGQQRLTTAVILLQAIVDIMRNLNEGKTDDNIYLGSFKLSEIVKQYLARVQEPQQIVRTYLLGYTYDDPSFLFLRHKIFGEDSPGTLQETFYTLNLSYAKTYFLEQVKNIASSQGMEGIRSIYKKLTQQLRFNEYIVENDLNVFVAFETMNIRGKKLSNLELLKNRMIYLTTLYPESEIKQDILAKLNKNINETWKEVYYQLGRNPEHPLNDDEFLRAHWIMYFKYSREKSNDYIRDLLESQFTPKKIYRKTEIEVPISVPEEIRENLSFEQDEENSKEETATKTILISELTPREIKDYVLSLKDSAHHWYNTFFPDRSTELSTNEKEWIDKLNRVGAGYFRPLVVSLFMTKIEEVTRISVLKEIERFIFICFRLCRAASNYKSSEFYNASRELFRGEITTDRIISRLREHMKWWFNDDGTFNVGSFHSYLSRMFKDTGIGYYGWYGALQYFLYEYELDLMKSRGQPYLHWNLFTKSERDKVSIEHILPQTPDNDYWKSHFSKYNDNQRRILAGSLGNLLPLSSAINSSLQNDAFPDKKALKKDANGNVLRSGYKNGSYSEREVADDYEVWNAQSIKTRGLKLINFMERRWEIRFADESDKLKLLFLEDMPE